MKTLLEGGEPSEMPWGLDRHDVLSLIASERYHWTDQQLQEEPAQKYLYFPLMWSAVEQIQAEAARRAEQQAKNS